MRDPTLGIDIGPLEHSSAQGAVGINFDTWTRRKVIDHVAGSPTDSIRRSDLIRLAADVEWDAPDRALNATLEHLFVRTMMWGSGTTNGRGPRYTEKALESGRVGSVLAEVRQHLAAGDIAASYRFHRRLPGVGPAFFTKLLWVIGTTVEVSPQPLILDARVWASLGALGWNSKTAAGSRHWADRYVAYLLASAKWAERSPGVHSAEDVEYTLYRRNGAPTNPPSGQVQGPADTTS